MVEDCDYTPPVRSSAGTGGPRDSFSERQYGSAERTIDLHVKFDLQFYSRYMYNDRSMVHPNRSVLRLLTQQLSPSQVSSQACRPLSPVTNKLQTRAPARHIKKSA